MPYVVALDQGTTSSRAIVFDEAGQIVAIEQTEFKQHYPRSGWVEHDPDEIWSSQIGVAEAVLATAKLRPSDVAAVGITNQRETAVVWDRATGAPIHPAIVWQDRRTAETCDALRAAGHLQAIRDKTGLLLDSYFCGPKIAWILDHVPGARAQAEAGQLACGTIDSWLLWKLTAGARHITDATNASRTLLMNIHTGTWDDELLEIINVPRDILPEIRGSSEIYAEVDSSLPLAGIAIGGMAGDQQAALFGQACFQEGEAKNTYGTGCFMLMNTGKQAIASQNNLLTTISSKIGDDVEYAFEGSVFIGGAVVSWLRDGLGIIRTSSEVEALASSVPDSGGVYVVPAFAGLGAPHWDPYARGTIVGISGGTTKAHLARAAVESIAFQVADLAVAMRDDAHRPLGELRVDGGASVNDALLQHQADILQLPVVRPAVTESTAQGAAYLAGLAAGVWPDRRSVAQLQKVERQFEPEISAAEAGAQLARWRQAVERAKGWAEA